MSIVDLSVSVDLYVSNEVSVLESVVLGNAKSMGPMPHVSETFDAKSRESVKNKIYPTQQDVLFENNAFESILNKYKVHVYRPTLIEDCNQIFTRDLAFVIEDKFIISNIIEDRSREILGLNHIMQNISPKKIVHLPDKVHLEGGDVIIHNDHIFVGFYSGSDYARLKTARTNVEAVDYLKHLFPNKTIKALDLIKSDTDPLLGALHLDCVFQPIGLDRGIIYKEGFRNKKDYHYLLDFFGHKNLFHITQKEAYYMFSNVFSLAPNILVSEQRFKRLNDFLTNQWGFTVEEVPYFETSKMGGLLRCSTLPLQRKIEI